MALLAGYRPAPHMTPSRTDLPQTTSHQNILWPRDLLPSHALQSSTANTARAPVGTPCK